MENSAQIFNKNKALLIKDVVPLEVCKFLTHILLRCPDMKYGIIDGDSQVPTATSVSHEIIFETILEKIWPYLEVIVGEELMPTYAYARLYNNGHVLAKHTDRPACEVSMTIQLGRSHHYSWPIFIGGYRYDLAEGDGIVYKGCEVEHWRNECDGPKDYYSGQVFLHFVRKNGACTNEIGDIKNRKLEALPFVKHRSHLMENK